MCLHILAPFHAEILKSSCYQTSVEVTFGVDVDVELFRLRLQINKNPHILLKL